MPKPVLNLWDTSSSEEEEEKEIPPPPPKKSKQRTSEPPKSITRTTKVKPSKRVTRRNDIEEDDEEEGKLSWFQRTESAGLWQFQDSPFSGRPDRFQWEAPGKLRTRQRSPGTFPTDCPDGQICSSIFPNFHLFR